MKKLFVILLSMIMLMPGAFSAAAEDDDDMYFDVPDSKGNVYIISYPRENSDATELVGKRYIRVAGYIDDFRISLTSESGEHEVQIELASIDGGEPLISDTFTATEDGTSYKYINENTESLNNRLIIDMMEAGTWKGNEKIIAMPEEGSCYAVYLTVPEGAVGEMSLKFSGEAVADSGSSIDTISVTTGSTGGDGEVTSITPNEKEVGIYQGEKKTIAVESEKSITVEVEDESVVRASYSGGMLTIEGLKRGESMIWLRTSDNYAGISVKVMYDSALGASDWAKGEIRSAIEKGFVPDEIQEDWTKSITREEFAKMAVMFLGLEPMVGGKPFEDTTSAYIAAAYSAGIVNGVGDNKFNPRGSITRQEAAVMLMRTAKCAGEETELQGEEFDDTESAADWAKDAILWARARGVMQGDENGNFNPNDEYTREEAIVTFMRLAA
ncbi:MAG: S-layer homology domain-containing protein [Clostridia bacterium]|nr:S-layer homology domain-containing protein [Clostridia bacterium]